MFSGIIESTGTIARVDRDTVNSRLTIASGTLGLDDVAIGDSIAVNGVCLTIVAISTQDFSVDVSAETLACSTGFEAGGEVNLEKSLRFGDRLGGHMVSGHVDAVGAVKTMQDLGAHWRLEIEAPGDLGRFIARKGSIAVNGVSLTVNRVDNGQSRCVFEVNIIPHTLAVTTLGRAKSGTRVNLEVDMLARYVERMLARSIEGGDA